MIYVTPGGRLGAPPSVAINKINAKQDPAFTQTAPIIEWQETSQIDTSIVSYIMPR